MRLRLLLLCFASLLIAQGRAQSDSSRPTTSSASRTAARPGAKGPLPDPVLLDGSNQPAEKHPDYGMLGKFEIPGDENAKSGKVGGQQNPNQQGGGGGQQPQNQSQQGGGGQMAGMPQGASGGGGQQSQQAAGQGGQPGGQQGGQQAGGAAGGAQQIAGAQGGTGTQGGAQGGDPTGKAEGIQVAGLEGESSGQAGGGGAGDNVPKPQQVAIGDPTMQIKSGANAPGVVGQVAAGSTQQMESKIGKGTGGGGGSPTSGGGGRGVEKGRAMPAGL